MALFTTMIAYDDGLCAIHIVVWTCGHRLALTNHIYEKYECTIRMKMWTILYNIIWPYDTYYDPMILWSYDTLTLWQACILPLNYRCNTMSLWYYGRMILYDRMILSLFDKLVFYHWTTDAILWPYDTTTVWYNGPMVHT